MKKFLCLSLVLVLVFSLTVPAFAASGDTIVYKTRTGEKYHSDGCQYLRQSCYEITLAKAVDAGLSPCSKCHPPRLDVSASITLTPSPVPTFDLPPLPSLKPAPTLPSTYRSSRQTVQQTPQPSATIEVVPPKDALKGTLLGFSPLVGGLLIALLVKVMRDKKRKALEEAARRQREYEQWLAEKAEYTKQYGGKPLLELAGAPHYCFVADDGLPAASGKERWGYGYTFYVTYSGQAFHKSTCRFAQGGLPKNAYSLYRWSDKHPCSYCRPKLPDLSWYHEYLKIKAIKEKYQID